MRGVEGAVKVATVQELSVEAEQMRAEAKQEEAMMEEAAAAAQESKDRRARS